MGTKQWSIAFLASVTVVCMLTVLVVLSVPVSADCPCVTIDTDTINGSIYYKTFTVFPGASAGGGHTATRTFTNVPAGVKIARVHTGVWMLDPGNVEVTVNGAVSGPRTALGCGCNAINDPDLHSYCTGCGVHFITYGATADIPSGGGDVTVTVESTNAGDGRLYTIALLVVYENASMPSVTYWINEGAWYIDTGPGNVYFNGAYPPGVTDVTYWTLGMPHGVQAHPDLNGNYIGDPDYHEGDAYDFWRWDNINTDWLDLTSNLMYYAGPGGYERVDTAVFMLERGGGGDTTPPASVTNLQNVTYEQTYISWTWTDPGDADFSHVMVYLNGVPKPNVTKGVQCYNATGLLPNNSYEIATHTVDTTGNVNQTWVNHSAWTAPASASDLVITKAWMNWPTNCSICYNVTNIGNGTASAGHNTTLYVDGNETAYEIVPVLLASNESYISCFDSYTWSFTPSEDNITVCADNNKTVAENNETNNCLTNIWMCGDVKKDGNVTAWDVSVLNSYVAEIVELEIEQKWAGDVNDDGYITAWDVSVLNSYVAEIGAISCKCQQSP